MISRRSLAVGLASTGFAGALLSSPRALAQIGSQPVKVVVPFPPGGTTDVVARIVLPPLGESAGRQYVVDNKGGAGGTIGAASVAQAAPDGNTLLLFHIGMIYGSFLFKSLPYDVNRDFSPISTLGTAASVLITPTSSAANTVAEFVAQAKASPRPFTFASAGIGTSGHLASELFKRQSGVNVTHTAYRGGGPAVTATLSGEVQFMIETLGSVVSHIKAGRLKALAVTGAERDPALPDVPTMREAGLPDYVYGTWYGLWAPAKMPEPLVAKLNASVASVLARDGVKSAMITAGIAPTASTVEDFKKTITSDLDKWGRIIREAGIEPQ